MKVWIFLGLLVIVVQGQLPSETPSTCASTSCFVGTSCKEVYNTGSGVITGQCLNNVQPTGNENVCTEGGQPLYKTNADDSVSEVFCGRGINRMDCPSGYECKIAENDAYAVCCPIQSTEKPGVCPAPSGMMGTCEFDPNVNCLEDSECDGDLKCCSEGCNKICKEPEATEKPGVCPAPSGMMGTCVFDPNVNCLEDSECDGDLKCCSEGCNKICKEPEATEKPGVCPAPSGMMGTCVFDPNVNCLEDSECDGDLKCCSEGCNKICKEPEATEKPGVCPAPSGMMGTCVFDPNVNCLEDSECDGDLKCCSEGCNKICKEPEATEKPGVCPAPSGMMGTCVFDPNVNCLEDSECDGDLKCCSEGCNKICKAPEGNTAWQCPAAAYTGTCELDPIVHCDIDMDCGDPGLKCCSDGCNRYCLGREDVSAASITCTGGVIFAALTSLLATFIVCSQRV